MILHISAALKLTALLLGVLLSSRINNILVTADDDFFHDLSIDCSKTENQSEIECMCRLPENWKMDFCQSSRIVGGVDAPLDAYPWFARLVFRDGTGRGCGGMLVAPEYVLTAAHCISNKYTASAAVQIGSVCTSSSNNCGQPIQQINVQRIIRHPKYNVGMSFNNDYALLKLVSRSNATPVAM